jgi:hypothetical protein
LCFERIPLTSYSSILDQSDGHFLGQAILSDAADQSITDVLRDSSGIIEESQLEKLRSLWQTIDPFFVKLPHEMGLLMNCTASEVWKTK